MTRIQQALHNEVQALTVLRDEIKLQAHLFHAESRTRWQELEVRWDELKEHMQRAKVAAADTVPQVQGAAQELATALKTGYADLKNALKR
jgi:hypothetical protein